MQLRSTACVRGICRVTLALTLFSVVQYNVAHAEKTLRWKLRQGEALRVSFAQDMDMESVVLDKPIHASADMAMLMLWEVQGVDPQGTSITKQTIERLKMTMETPGGDPVVYDSASKEVPQGMAATLATSIQPLVGVEFIQQMNNRGEILDVQLSDTGAARLAAAPAGAQLQQVFSKDGLRALLNQAATVLPEHAIKPGDRWQGVTETKSPVGTLRMQNTYTYRGTENRSGRDLERIDVEVQVSFGDDVNALGLDVTIKEQQNSGIMYFDAQAGRFVESIMNQKMTLETAIGDRTHHQKLDTKLRMRLASATSRPPATRTSQRPERKAVIQPAAVRRNGQ